MKEARHSANHESLNEISPYSLSSGPDEGLNRAYTAFVRWQMQSGSATSFLRYIDLRLYLNFRRMHLRRPPLQLVT